MFTFVSIGLLYAGAWIFPLRSSVNVPNKKPAEEPSP